VKRAVLVSIVDDKGTLRLSLDDVESTVADPRLWAQKEHYTSRPITEAELLELKFGDKELSDFAYHIMARLYAFKVRKET
jgi:hypothetical protein